MLCLVLYTHTVNGIHGSRFSCCVWFSTHIQWMVSMVAGFHVVFTLVNQESLILPEQVTSLPVFFIIIMSSCCIAPCSFLLYFIFVFAPLLLFSVSVSDLGILCSSFVKTIYDIFCLHYEYCSIWFCHVCQPRQEKLQNICYNRNC